MLRLDHPVLILDMSITMADRPEFAPWVMVGIQCLLGMAQSMQCALWLEVQCLRGCIMESLLHLHIT
jgi:hypothetical protein